VVSDLRRAAERAELLFRRVPSGSALLRFAAGLCRAQSELAEAIEAAHEERPLRGRLEEDAERFLEPSSAVLAYVAESGAEALGHEAGTRREETPATARARLLVYWEEGRGSGEDYLSRAILRPYVEILRRARVAPERSRRRGRCPFCGGAPWIGVRRDGSTMEGARRHLRCALCAFEWPVGRILCTACFEEDPYKLPSFQSERHPAVRIEACETCRRYVKTIDLSEDATPIPEVDELVSLSMDFWAAEEGFTRIEPGIAGELPSPVD
jgi:FdhE protein